MKNRHLFAAWGVLYILCAGLGFIPEQTGFVKFLLVTCALLFFVPGFLLLYRGIAAGDRTLVCWIRDLALVSLVLTTALLIANIASAIGSVLLGNILFALLVLVSAPMLCGQYWVMSLFLWACLLFGAILRMPAPEDQKSSKPSNRK